MAMANLGEDISTSTDQHLGHFDIAPGNRCMQWCPSLSVPRIKLHHTKVRRPGKQAVAR